MSLDRLKHTTVNCRGTSGNRLVPPDGRGRILPGMSSGAPASPVDRRPALFATTRWSVVQSAGHPSSPDAREALEALCRTYWYPLYAYARRRGASPDDAADSTQEFFSRLLEQDYLTTADREKGRFRSFLLTVFKRHLATEYEQARALKRGGDRRILSFDLEAGEQRYRNEPSDDWTPEALYDRRWALTLLEQVMAELQSEYEARDKGPLFEFCKPLLTAADDRTSYDEIGRELQMSEPAVRVAVHRMRARYREMLRREVAQTLGQADSVEDELQYLRAAIRGKNP